MSSSVEDSKIDLLDPPNVVKKKLKKAFCEEGNIENNGILSFAKYCIFPILDGRPFIIERKEANGGRITFENYQILESIFAKKVIFRTNFMPLNHYKLELLFSLFQELHPGDLKLGVEQFINELLAPIIEKFKSPELTKLVDDAYTIKKPMTEKKKKVKENKKTIEENKKTIETWIFCIVIINFRLFPYL